MRVYSKIEKLTLSSLLLAVGIILPFAASHGLGIPGTVLLPMHIPVFLAGFLLGAPYAAVLGAVLPLLNTLLTGMPVLYPMLPLMTAELFTYGLISGLIYHKTPLFGKKWGVYLSMLAAMLAGRGAYGIIFGFLLLYGEHKAASVTTAFATGLLGIIIQLLLVPALVFTIGNFRMNIKENIIESAKNLIADERASAVVIKDGKLLSTELDRGIAPIITLYERGLLKDAFVVDKVVGKAAAQIMTLGKIKYCYGLTMSKSALEYLQKNGITAEYGTLADYIINRTKDGVCPMEKTVENIDDPALAFDAVKKKLAELRSENRGK